MATLCALQPVLADELLSDRVTVIEADGRTHTVQHTLFSDAVLATLKLPGSVVPLRVAFGGPERLTFQSAWEARSEQIALWSGSAFVRYRHQYGEAVERLSDGAWRLRASSFPPGLSIESPEAASGSDPVRIDLASTWVFPSDMDVLDWQADAAADGEWTFEDNSIGWQQRGTEPVGLTITYRSRSEAMPLADSLAPVTAPAPASDRPATGLPQASAQEVRASQVGGDVDTDADEVVDAMDVCIGPIIPALAEPNAADDVDVSPLPGCDGASRVVLTGIGFDVGQSQLDESARRVLDRVANALMSMPGDSNHEIAAHTDSQGRWPNNLALSKRRARAVRQYLLLRGVPAGSLSATGYGETRPISDNSTATGRRENRRIELGPLSPNAPVDD